LIKEDDRQALATMVLQGRAIVIKNGMRATIEDVDVFRVLERFHVRGLPASLYTDYGTIE
jgi:hypothetical protein